MTSNTSYTSTNSPESEIDYGSYDLRVILEDYDKYLRYEANSAEISNIGLPTWLYVILVAIGILGNIINVTVFNRESMRSPLNFLLASLEAINILGFLTYIPYIVFVYKKSGHVTYTWAVTDYINKFLISFAMSSSNWLTVTISIFRVIAVSKPLASVKLCSKKRAVSSLVTILVLSLLISVTLFYANQVRGYKVGVFNRYVNQPKTSKSSVNQSETQPPIEKELENKIKFYNQSEADLEAVNESESDIKAVNQSETKIKPVYKFIYETYWYFCIGESKLKSEENLAIQSMSAVFLLETTVPCLVTVISTIVLLVNLWRASGRRKSLRAVMAAENRDSNRNERKVTIMLLVILVLYVLAIIPHAIVHAVLLVAPDHEIWFSYVKNLATSRIGLLFTNAITFFVYLSMSDKYRKAFKELMGRVKTRFDFRTKQLVGECVTLETVT